MDVVKRVQNCKSKCNRLSVSEQVKKNGAHILTCNFQNSQNEICWKKKLD